MKSHRCDESFLHDVTVQQLHNYYPENTVACYTTKLANAVELEGDWKVGLAEMSIPSAVYNVVANHLAG